MINNFSFRASALTLSFCPLSLSCNFLPFQLIFSSENGRFSITEEGSLKITSVTGEDQGYYACTAYSNVGSVKSKAFLRVIGKLFLMLDEVKDNTGYRSSSRSNFSPQLRLQ